MSNLIESDDIYPTTETDVLGVEAVDALPSNIHFTIIYLRQAKHSLAMSVNDPFFYRLWIALRL